MPSSIGKFVCRNGTGRRCVDRIVANAALLLSHAKLRAILFTGSLSRDNINRHLEVLWSGVGRAA